MVEKNISGILLYKKNFGLYDQIIKIMSADKIYFLIAKGVQRPTSKNRKQLKIGALIDFIYFDRENKRNFFRLKKAELIKSFEFEGYWAGRYWNKVLEILKQLDNSNIYPLLNNLNKIIINENALPGWLWFLAQIISKNGHKPIVDKCVECGTTKRIFSFEIEGGGLKCIDHAFSIKDKQSVECISQYIYLFSLSYENYIKKMSTKYLVKQESVLINFLNYHVGIYIENDRI